MTPFDKLRAGPSPASGRRGALTADDLETLLAPFGTIDHLLLAVSGGPDSVALMGLAAALGGTPVTVATVDHRLRPDSRGEAEAVGRMAAAFGLPHTILPWQGPPPTSRIQEAARNGRYALLVAHARAIGASHLATAHTLDDQAETILYRLARGSGASGLVGMRPSMHRDGIVHLRPLLGVRKARLIATCEANRWAFHADPSNADPRYARSRWRRILPQLEAEGLGPDRFAVLSQRLVRIEEALDRQVERVTAAAVVEEADGRIDFDARLLASEPEEIVLRVLARALSGIAVQASPLRLQRLERLCREMRAAITAGTPLKRTLAGAIVWLRSDATIRVCREPRRRSASPADSRVGVAGVDHETNWTG